MTIYSALSSPDCDKLQRGASFDNQYDDERYTLSILLKCFFLRHRVSVAPFFIRVGQLGRLTEFGIMI